MVAPQTEMFWQPNKAVCAALSLSATALVLAALIYMFSRSLGPPIRVVPIELRLISGTVKEQEHHQSRSPRFVRSRKIEIVKPQLMLIKPVEIPLKNIRPLPQPIDWQQQMEIAVENQPQSNEIPSSMMSNKMQVFTPLQQALNAPRKPAVMQNGESYRSIYGQVVLESNGLCTELQTIQFGPSPSDHVTVALMPPHQCAGEYKSTMSEELSKWVDQEVQKHPPSR